MKHYFYIKITEAFRFFPKTETISSNIVINQKLSPQEISSKKLNDKNSSSEQIAFGKLKTEVKIFS